MTSVMGSEAKSLKSQVVILKPCKDFTLREAEANFIYHG